ncbi:GNAT family N-acetyltransferase [Alkalicoccobacillus porphyridii]|uniref:GNAT family N-acetyltransferase n=1 Tax=Alkalicoccobacillus porphyridii TaxID=2597270 RepID=A0A553ZWZ1_9BACI|nr:GNAT family N-acetyltransferase [Alkalicoccobacillus porphyridii]TSB45962.1 GNAT family N-acetyltransferase [Alkalicoccobacillus porphyridii]
MIRKLTKDDTENCLQFLKQKPAENLFIIGDIEAFGMETDFQTCWGEFNEQGEFVAVLLKYYENYIPYAPATFNASAFAGIMKQDPKFGAMSCLKAVAEQIEPFLPSYQIKRELYYAKCIAVAPEIHKSNNIVETAIPDDAEELVQFLGEIPEFSASQPLSVEKKREDLETGFSRSFIVRQEGSIVANASTTAENSSSAMVIAVATLDAYKNKGYATACVHNLCQALLNEGKEPCLFYDNPKAGSIYKRIGFRDIGFWMMYHF